MQRRMAHGLMVAVVIIGLGAAQGPNSSEASSTPNIPTKKPENRKQATRRLPYQIGTASWYGEYFEGKPTASGENYDMFDLTAAHPTLPLGTYVRVTNLHNGRAVVVKVNDRGPIVPGRIIDLSYGAAKVLKFEHRGLQRVRLDLVKPRQRQNYETVAFNDPLADLP
jgi:rare lipoprotein A